LFFYKPWIYQGGKIAGNTRKEIEANTGKKIVSALNEKSLKTNYIKEIIKIE